MTQRDKICGLGTVQIALFFAGAGLKLLLWLCGVSVSWWLVTLPLWGPVVLGIAVAALSLMGAVVIVVGVMVMTITEIYPRPEAMPWHSE